MLTRTLFLYLLLSPLMALSQSAQTATQENQAQEYTLSNGLKLIVKEDHRSPVVVSQVWYRAGSLDEVNGRTGVAHVLEHMMFKGTKKVPVGQFSRQIAAVGGRENAFTNVDYTCYFEQLEKSYLPLAFKLEADRMANLDISKAEFEKEIKVVMEERRWRTDDKPQAKVNEQFQASAYRAHPYGRPVIGYMNDLENMTVDDAQAWYDNWYAPNNATVVVVGDVKADEVLALVKQYFGKLKAKELPVRKPQVEPKQIGVRRAVIKVPGKLPYLMIGFHTPVLDSEQTAENAWEPYALDVLAGVLSGNASARLNQQLVREKAIAVSVDAGYGSTSRGRNSLFELDGTPAVGQSVDMLEKAILAEIEKIKKEGVTQQELDRVKAAVISTDVYKRDSMFYQGMQIGQLETMDYDWHLLDTYSEKLKAVTSEQVQAVAKRYLVEDNMTVVSLDPQPIGPNAKPLGRPHIH